MSENPEQISYLSLTRAVYVKISKALGLVAIPIGMPAKMDYDAMLRARDLLADLPMDRIHKGATMTSMVLWLSSLTLSNSSRRAAEDDFGDDAEWLAAGSMLVMMQASDTIDAALGLLTGRLTEDDFTEE